MQPHPFHASAWQSQCQAAYDRCGKQAQTPMHHIFLFSQQMDDALAQLDAVHRGQGLQIVRGFGYETFAERNEYVGWFTQHQTDLDTARV